MKMMTLKMMRTPKKKQWLLIDATATRSVGMMNKQIFHGKEHAEDEPEIIGDSGTSDVNENKSSVCV